MVTLLGLLVCCSRWLFIEVTFLVKFNMLVENLFYVTV